MDRSQTQKYYLKLLRGGIKSEKTALSIAKSQLNTEQQIGVEAGTLNDTFLSLYDSGRLNNLELQEMGRGMRSVARSSGVTGEALAGAIKSSEQITEQFVKSGRLSTQVAKNVMNIVTHAKKFGIESEISEDLKAMSGLHSLIEETDKGTFAFLQHAAGSVGLQRELMNGTILESEDAINGMSKGYGNVLSKFINIPQEAMKNSKTLGDFIDQLGTEEKNLLDYRLKSAYGAKRALGVVRSGIEALDEASKGLEGQLAKISARKNLNLNAEEKLRDVELERSLITSKNLQILNSMSKATKGTESMDAAFAAFGKEKDKFSKDLKALNNTGVDNKDVIRKTIAGATKGLNAGRKNAGLAEIRVNSKDIEAALNDKSTYGLLIERLSQGEQELANELKNNNDPITKMEKHLLKINDNIRTYTQSLFSKMFNSILGELIVISGILASIAVVRWFICKL